jgi:hypothetical protein
MALSSEERVRRHRLREAGYELKPCPVMVSSEERVAWAEGVWKRQAEFFKALRPGRLSF